MSEHLVLVGKPSPEALEPMAIKLQELGYTLHVASNSSDALKLMETITPAATLVDISMPEINGIQVCSTIKANSTMMPVVALNHNEIGLRKAAMAVGADLVLDYPINWVDLKTWLSAPRAKNGTLAAIGPFLGSSKADTLGAASLLAHDLKSPISIIISSLEVLLGLYEEDNLPESTVRLLRGALHAAYRQMYMVSDLIDLARLELDNYELQLEELDMAQLIRDGLANESYALTIKGLQIATDLPQPPLLVRADRDLMKRVISALVESVIKFTVREDRLWISAGVENNQVVVRFSDTGRTIQAGFEQEIMRRAPQWERRQGGTRTSVAMALPFIYAVARAHNGDFTAQSDFDKQITTFTLTLPL